MKRSLVISVFAALFFSGCLFDSGSTRVTGKYFILWIDLRENQTLSEQSETSSSNFWPIVPEYVFAVGHNNDYIIAKQHPTNGFNGGFKVNTEITNYYIIDTNGKTLKEDNKVFGPMTLSNFDSLRTMLNISNLEFDMEYPDKP